MEKENRHHVIPVSLRWPDHERNILTIKESAHNHLHKILDIHPKIYSRMQRRAKKQSNDGVIMEPDGIEARADMQRLFFDRLSHLPKRLQREHVKKWMERLDHEAKKYRLLTWDEIDKPSRKTNPADQFHVLHECTIQAQKEVSKAILWMIKKNTIPY